MARVGKGRGRLATVLSIIAFAAFGTWVVVSSSDVAHYQCEVCIAFRGQELCRRVEGQTETEAYRGAVTNACALLASGVTDTLACERTPPSRSDCTGVN